MSNSAEDQTPKATEETNITRMQKLLEATLMRRDGSLDEQEWSQLRDVAAESNARAFSTVEFVENLIWTLCHMRFPVLTQDADNCRRMCHRIAATLSADPYARKRVAEFQSHLLRAES